MAPRLGLDHVTKHYGTVTALDDVSFALHAGEVHALLGENGAGKTTLMRLAFGLTRPDGGTITRDGRPVVIHNPRDAATLGIGMVHQHPTSIPRLTVAENVALAAGWPAHPRELRARLDALCDSLGLALDPDAPAGELPVALKQRLEIVKALAGETSILLLDEPTAVLTPQEVTTLFEFIRRFAAGGGAVALITHKLAEVTQSADTVTVLRRGRVTHSGPAAGETRRSLARHMVGHDLPGAEGRPEVPARGQVLVHLEDAALPAGPGQGTGLRHGSVQVRAGEIVGIAAVEGNGQRELLRAAAGVWPLAAGTRKVNGVPAFIPEDRTTEGLIAAMTVAENVVLGGDERAPWLRRTLGVTTVDWRRAAEVSDQVREQYGIVATGPAALVADLSGGNQQKLVLGRALLSRPSVIVAEDPTRGLDVGAALDIHRRLRTAAAEGAAVLLYSSDLDEVMELADRLVVVTDGTTVAVEGRPERSLLGELMLGGGPAR